jgi:hypothetical protein
MSRTFFFDSALGACAIRAKEKGAAAARDRRGPPAAVMHVSAAAKQTREHLVVIAAQAALVLAFCVIGAALVAIDEIKKRFTARGKKGDSQ